MTGSYQDGATVLLRAKLGALADSVDPPSITVARQRVAQIQLARHRRHLRVSVCAAALIVLGAVGAVLAVRPHNSQQLAVGSVLNVDGVPLHLSHALASSPTGRTAASGVVDPVLHESGTVLSVTNIYVSETTLQSAYDQEISKYGPAPQMDMAQDVWVVLVQGRVNPNAFGPTVGWLVEVRALAIPYMPLFETGFNSPSVPSWFDALQQTAA